MLYRDFIPHELAPGWPQTPRHAASLLIGEALAGRPIHARMGARAVDQRSNSSSITATAFC
jgi:hypothetical protein